MSLSNPFLAHPLPMHRLRRGDGIGSVNASERVRRRDRDTRIFGACLFVLALHLAADALVSPSTSNELAHRPLWLGIVLMPVLLLLFTHSGRVVRTLLAALVGLGALILGLITSIPHAALTGASGSDYTGILATLAGLLLLGLAFHIGLRGRRLAVKLAVAVPTCFVVLQWGVAPAITAGIVTNAPRPRIAQARTLGLAGARDVTFTSSDGVRLSGWYVPGENHAAVILLHGSHGTRVDTLPHLRMLAAAGYSVLSYDARGHGRSTGQANALGWQGVADIAAAIKFLSAPAGSRPATDRRTRLVDGGRGIAARRSEPCPACCRHRRWWRCLNAGRQRTGSARAGSRVRLGHLAHDARSRTRLGRC